MCALWCVGDETWKSVLETRGSLTARSRNHTINSEFLSTTDAARADDAPQRGTYIKTVQVFISKKPKRAMKRAPFRATRVCSNPQNTTGNFQKPRGVRRGVRDTERRVRGLRLGLGPGDSEFVPERSAPGRDAPVPERITYCHISSKMKAHIFPTQEFRPSFRESGCARRASRLGTYLERERARTTLLFNLRGANACER